MTTEKTCEGGVGIIEGPGGQLLAEKRTPFNRTDLKLWLIILAQAPERRAFKRFRILKTLKHCAPTDCERAKQ